MISCPYCDSQEAKGLAVFDTETELDKHVRTVHIVKRIDWDKYITNPGRNVSKK